MRRASAALLYEASTTVVHGVPDFDWAALRVVVKNPKIVVYVGPVKLPTLEVRKLGSTIEA